MASTIIFLSTFSFQLSIPAVTNLVIVFTYYKINLFISFFESVAYNFTYLGASSHQRYQMVFHWNLRDSKLSQVSKTLVNFLADPNNVVV